MTRKPSQPEMTKKYIQRFRRRLMKWYEMNKRILPWRDIQDPYHIWISETMLQQTQISRAEKYFNRFITAFPNVETLARSPLSEVLKMWEGLGYYARARNLHRAATRIAHHRQGQFPQTFEESITLPGIGPYTAAAIMSIAYNQPYPVVDGNVTRVLCRVFGIETDSKGTVTREKLLSVSNELMPPGQAGTFNQALMELGSLLCRPRSPQCSECCLKPLCYAQTLSDPTVLPTRVSQRPRPHYDVTAGFIWKGRRLLLAQRPTQKMLGGLWEFPGGKKEPNETLQACLRREIKEELGIEIEVKEPIASVHHSYSHFRITLHGYHCQYCKGKIRPLGCYDWDWILPSDVRSFALPRADLKLFEAWECKRGS